MPANPEHLYSALENIGATLGAAALSLRTAQAAALRRLAEAAEDPQRLTLSVSAALAAEPALRCALPSTEKISSAIDPPPGSRPHPLLAVDGSQVVPSRHEEVAFGLINIASVLIEPGSGKVPEIITQTDLLFGDQLFVQGFRTISEGDLSLMRDLAERQALRRRAPDQQSAIVLTDGPLELWGAKDASDPAAFENALRSYLEALHDLHRRGCTPAGYVDKPGADLLVRALGLSTSTAAVSGTPDSMLLRGVSDRWLFGRLLAPGQRSAVFALQSSSRSRYTGDLALHFFYLNVGRETQPAIARVEMPAWVAQDAGAIGDLHAALLSQCALLGDRPYPYILHRAHEAARISPNEKEQIKLRLLLEMRNRGLEPEPLSPKSSAKAL